MEENDKTIEVDAEKKASAKSRAKNRKKNRPKKYRKRKFPIILRLLVVSLLLAASLIGGLMFGYGVIGDGKPKDILDKSTWQHIVDIVEKE